jgi:hypothetical protein
MKLSALIFLVIFSFSCAPTRIVKPLEKDEKLIGFNFGGPLIEFGGATIPIPFTSFYGAYGISEDLSVFGGLHTTSLAYGVFQTDIGVTKGLLKPSGWKPGVSLSPAMQLFVDRWEWNTKIYPELGVNAYWEYGEKTNKFFYMGIVSWFELQSRRAHEQNQTQRIIPNFQFGHTIERTRMNYTLEAKYFAPFTSNRDIVVEYKSFGSKGAVGLMFSIARKF